MGKERRRRLCTILEFGRGLVWVGFGLSGGRGGGSESRLVFFSPFLPPALPWIKEEGLSGKRRGGSGEIDQSPFYCRRR